MAEVKTVVATFRPREARYDLESLPGGWVLLKRMSYGARLQRLQLASSLKTSIKAGGRGESEDIPAEIVSALQETTYLDFKSCIMDHNLADDKGRLLDFRSNMAIDSLDPAIGEEISALIDRHNAELPEDEAPKSTTSSSTSTEDG